MPRKEEEVVADFSAETHREKFFPEKPRKGKYSWKKKKKSRRGKSLKDFYSEHPPARKVKANRPPAAGHVLIKSEDGLKGLDDVDLNQLIGQKPFGNIARHVDVMSGKSTYGKVDRKNGFNDDFSRHGEFHIVEI